MKTKYYCDHCGKELDWNKDYIDYDISYFVDNDVDICKECLDEYIEYTKNFIKAGEQK